MYNGLLSNTLYLFPDSTLSTNILLQPLNSWVNNETTKATYLITVGPRNRNNQSTILILPPKGSIYKSCPSSEALTHLDQRLFPAHMSYDTLALAIGDVSVEFLDHLQQPFQKNPHMFQRWTASHPSANLLSYPE